MIPEENRGCFAWAGGFRLGGECFRWHGVTIQTTRGQMALVAVLENGWGEGELAAKPGRVLDLNGWRNGLQGQLVSIPTEATPPVYAATEV